VTQKTNFQFAWGNLFTLLVPTLSRPTFGSTGGISLTGNPGRRIFNSALVPLVSVLVHTRAEFCLIWLYFQIART
jgi:hypothetical protein